MHTPCKKLYRGIRKNADGWVINMVCQDIFPFAHCSSGTDWQPQNKAYGHVELLNTTCGLAQAGSLDSDLTQLWSMVSSPSQLRDKTRGPSQPQSPACSIIEQRGCYNMITCCDRDEHLVCCIRSVLCRGGL